MAHETKREMRTRLRSLNSSGASGDPQLINLRNAKKAGEKMQMIDSVLV